MLEYMYMKKHVFIIILVLFIAAGADATERRNFYIESEYDLRGRDKLTAALIKITPQIYFYVDESWWNFINQDEIYQVLDELGKEFEDNIYPTLTSVFGPEWKPGIDKDSKITILIHPMKDSSGGYFSSKDEYSKFEASDSNEREMIYLNSEHIISPQNKSYLAHEFVHLITFHQKDNTHNVIEDVWLNEARAEYASTLMGYDDVYKGSNLANRAQFFSENPFDSLIEWEGEKSDYGIVNLFIQYLVDHYGIEILRDSLFSSEIGIESINYALDKNGFEQDFFQVFLDWTIAVFINDCSYGSKYCYTNENLQNLHVATRTNFLPMNGESTLTVVDTTKIWTGNWYKIIGGRNDLKLEFISSSAGCFKVPYITKSKAGSYKVDFLEFDNAQQDEIFIEDFSTEINSLIIIPIVKGDAQCADKLFHSFSWSVSIKKAKEESDLIKNLLAQIEQLTAEITRIQAKINSILANQGNQLGQQSQKTQIINNLYYGLTNNQQVRSLQEFLKSQSPEIYPEGLITGNFLTLTKNAVIRFQEKHALEILSPWELTKGNGFVGKLTRDKINELSR